MGMIFANKQYEKMASKWLQGVKKGPKMTQIPKNTCIGFPYLESEAWPSFQSVIYSVESLNNTHHKPFEDF